MAIFEGMTGTVAAEISCEAAIRVKPKARLCEPWVPTI